MTDKPLRDIILPPVYALEMEPISLLLKKLQQAKTHVAVVVDEYGGTCGIVTMEDILEELVGEIWDEHDEEETPISKGSDGTYLVDAEMSFDDFADYFGLRSDSDMASVSGWVMEQFGRLPETGASFDFETLHVQSRGSRTIILSRSGFPRPQMNRRAPVRKLELRRSSFGKLLTGAAYNISEFQIAN